MSKRDLFTPEELAELAAFDAELDGEDILLTKEEREASRTRDRMSRMDRMDNQSRAIAEQKRRYYAENREAIAEQQRRYRAENRKIESNWLADWRRAHGFTQREAATLLGVSQGTISNWEHGIGTPEPGDILCGAYAREVSA